MLINVFNDVSSSNSIPTLDAVADTKTMPSQARFKKLLNDQAKIEDDYFIKLRNANSNVPYPNGSIEAKQPQSVPSIK